MSNVKVPILKNLKKYDEDNYLGRWGCYRVCVKRIRPLTWQVRFMIEYPRNSLYSYLVRTDVFSCPYIIYEGNFKCAMQVAKTAIFSYYHYSWQSIETLGNFSLYTIGERLTLILEGIKYPQSDCYNVFFNWKICQGSHILITGEESGLKQTKSTLKEVAKYLVENELIDFYG